MKTYQYKRLIRVRPVEGESWQTKGVLQVSMFLMWKSMCGGVDVCL